MTHQNLWGVIVKLGAKTLGKEDMFKINDVSFLSSQLREWNKLNRREQKKVH